MLDAREIYPLSDFQRNARQFIEQIQSSHKPIILTVNGKASVIMQDAASYQELLDELELARSAAKIRQGIAESAAGKTKDAVGGPVGIAQTFYALAGTGAQTRIELLASLSLSLFIFNMFPIPILDGGHLVLFTIEAIRRKKLSAINMQRVYLAGAAIMGLLFLTIMWNDVVKLIAPK